jgi:putative addiction module component (TIGR02574 family)
MKTTHWDEILELDVDERIELAEDIWDSIVAVPERVRLADWQREELRRRLEQYRADPSAGSPWDVVKQRIRSSR